jgi:pyruvate dehydrogenase (quinone)
MAFSSQWRVEHPLTDPPRKVCYGRFVVIPGDIALQTTDAKPPKWIAPRRPLVRPDDQDLHALAELLNGARRVTMLCGAGCAGAHDLVVRLADALKAPIVHPLRGKEHVKRLV